MKSIIVMLTLFCGILGCSENHACCENQTKQEEVEISAFSEESQPPKRYETHDSVLVAEYYAWREWKKTNPEGTYEDFVADTE